MPGIPTGCLHLAPRAAVTSWRLRSSSRLGSGGADRRLRAPTTLAVRGRSPARPAPAIAWRVMPVRPAVWLRRRYAPRVTARPAPTRLIPPSAPSAYGVTSWPPTAQVLGGGEGVATTTPGAPAWSWFIAFAGAAAATRRAAVAVVPSASRTSTVLDAFLFVRAEMTADAAEVPCVRFMIAPLRFCGRLPLSSPSAGRRRGHIGHLRSQMARDSLDLVTRGARRLRLRRPGARANSAGAGPPGGCLEPTGRARKDFVVAARNDLGRGALGDSEGRATAPIGGKPGGHRRGRAASQDRMLRISSPKPERTPRPTLGQGGGATARRAPHRRAVGALQSLLDVLLGVGPRVAGRGGQAGPMVPCWSTITRCGSTSGSRVASGGSTASRPGTLERDPPSLPRWHDSARRGSPLALAAPSPRRPPPHPWDSARLARTRGRRFAPRTGVPWMHGTPAVVTRAVPGRRQGRAGPLRQRPGRGSVRRASRKYV